jgi:hypothetical protein
MTSPISSPRPFSAPPDLAASSAFSAEPPSAADTDCSLQASQNAEPAGSNLSALDRLLGQDEARFHRRTVTFDGSEQGVRTSLSEDADDGAAFDSDGSWELSEDQASEFQQELASLGRQWNLNQGDLERVRQDLNDAGDALDRLDLTSVELLAISQRAQAETADLLRRFESEDAVEVGSSQSDVASDLDVSLGSSHREIQSPVSASSASLVEAVSSEEIPLEEPVNGQVAAGTAIPPEVVRAELASTAELSAPKEASSTEAPVPAQGSAPGQPALAAAPSKLQRLLGFVQGLGTQIANFFRWIFSGLFSGRPLQ